MVKSCHVYCGCSDPLRNTTLHCPKVQGDIRSDIWVPILICAQIQMDTQNHLGWQINPAQNVSQICLPHEKIPNFQTVQMNFAQLALKRWFRCYGKLKPNSARVAKWACLLCIGMWFWMAGWSLQWARWDIYLDLPISSTSAVIMIALTWSQWQSVTRESRSNFETILKTYQSKTRVYNVWHNVTHARETFWGLKIFLSSETRLKMLYGQVLQSRMDKLFENISQERLWWMHGFARKVSESMWKW